MKFILTSFLLFLSGNIFSQELKTLAEKISAGQPKESKYAVMEFSYTDSKKSQGPVIVQERLTTILASMKLTLVERNLVKKVMEELKLQNSGAIDSQTAAEAGKLLGADILITGTLNDLSDTKTEINARCVEVKTGKILSASSAVIEKTWKDSQTSGQNTGDYSGKSLIQIALLLDTSSSMDGLINQAKTHLWKIVNELAGSSKKGDASIVQVALYEYGNNSIPKEKGYIRQISPFTSDLDKISKQLFELKTNGGEEYCGQAVKEAVENLKWSKKDDVYKAIFVAGNEPYTQGPVSFEEASALAKSKGIFVNTIFCGSKQQGIAMQWKRGAELTDGEYANIDQNFQIADISAPQDREISETASKLNETFVPYGEKGKKSFEEKKEMDMKMNTAPAAIAYERAAYGASKSAAQANSQWDLISALETGALKRSEIKKEELPENLAKMSDKELNEHIDAKLKEREETKKKLIKLKQERDEYIKSKNENQQKETLDNRIIEIIRKQASKKGYSFK
ncbi:MAG: VWA domain-containing protein [Elusimicrobia bacterium]|nr:VWA domain-containing protein [Elusimicrobiota bacterium]